MKALAWTLFLAATAAASHAPAAGPVSELRFATGTLAGWEREGDAFYVTTAGGRGPSLRCGVCSSDRGGPGRTGLLRKEFVVPSGAGEVRFHAYAVCAGAGKDGKGDGRLDVLLAASDRRILPKQVLTDQGWQYAPLLLPRRHGQAREYRWNVAAYQGRTLQILIGDEDRRPGCYVFCSGFRIVPQAGADPDSFTRFMNALAERHNLAPPARYESRHFIALSNADDRFTRDRLKNCELIYNLFFDHFQEKGFDVQPPPGKLMVAIFDSQAGFYAYLGRRISPTIAGIYHPQTNRLVIYDYGSNEVFEARKGQYLAKGRDPALRYDRNRYVDSVERWAREYRSETNTGTTMHEVAHQLSFNCGMLNRYGDVPCWLAEGLACYCEGSDAGAWHGVGGSNPGRLYGLSQALGGRGNLLGLQDLVASDGWLRGERGREGVLNGYAQSWALFRMFMEEQPAALRRYLALTYRRPAPDHRLADFRQCFGGDLGALERRYADYLRKLVREEKVIR